VDGIAGNLTSNGENQVVNLTLPVPVITGTVYQADGTTPAPNPNVTVTVPNFSNPVTFFGISDANGVYSVAVPANDQASIIANAGGLTTQAQYYVHSTDTIDTQDITLHASGTVTGTFMDTNGNPLINQQIQVISDGSLYTLFIQTDDNGVYTMPYVATGNITATATVYYYPDCQSTANGVLANDGDTLTLNLTIDLSTCGTQPPPGAVRARNKLPSSVPQTMQLVALVGPKGRDSAQGVRP
jgi:hypothetical protein